MAYWWVNHGQTFKSEIEGGYIWSPKKKSNGASNQTYTNLTLTRPGDIVFSYASGKIKGIGVVSSKFREQSKPEEFGSAGERWDDKGWVVPIVWELLIFPLVPREHIETIAPLLPEQNSPLNQNGQGNQNCYLASISEDLGVLLERLIHSDNHDIATFIENEKNEVKDHELIREMKSSSIISTEIEQLIKARKGQGRFRQNVTNIESKCRVTGVCERAVLVASHIKPWRESSNVERLDGFNGLLLSPHIDKLFDKGWISFSDTGDLLYASSKVREILSKWNIILPLNVGAFSREQVSYMSYHRLHVFKGEWK